MTDLQGELFGAHVDAHQVEVPKPAARVLDCPECGKPLEPCVVCGRPFITNVARHAPGGHHHPMGCRP